MTRDITLGSPITGFTGVNGAGKTLLAVQSAIERMRAGIPVYSTVAISTRAKDGTLLESIPIVQLRQLLTLHDCVLLLDEVSVIFSNRSAQSLPAELEILLQTLRHRRVEVMWTAPAWSRAAIDLRIVTTALVSVVPVMRVADGTPWPRPRFCFAALLDTSTGKVDEMPTRVLRRVIYRPRSLAAWGAYDTHSDTPQLAAHRHSGICVECGGSVARPKHSEERHNRLGIAWLGDDSLDQAQADLNAVKAQVASQEPDSPPVLLDEAVTEPSSVTVAFAQHAERVGGRKGA